MNLIYCVIYIFAFSPLPLTLLAEFLIPVEPEIVFGLLTTSFFAFGWIFMNTEEWKEKKWASMVLGVFTMGGIAVYLTLRIVFEHS